jgi:uncharacterized membrane protein HdeD (DUF308 family)
MHTVLHEYWRSVALRGLSGIICGALALFEPRLTLTAIILVFAGYLVFDGTLTARVGYQSRTRRGGHLMLLEGIFRIVVGFALVPLVGLTGPAIGYVLSFLVLVTGAIQLWLAYRMRQFAFAGPYWALAGIGSVLLGLFLLSHPEVGAGLLVLLMGLYSLIFGVSMLALAHHLRRVERRLRLDEDASAPPNARHA